jgi:leader peptidase (prepilin peptidase)/N-methyltransferase
MTCRPFTRQTVSEQAGSHILDLGWAAAGAVAGLAAGTCMRVPVYSMSVRSGEPDRAWCLSCGAPLPAHAAMRCEHCAAWVGAPWMLEVLSAAVAGLLLGQFAGRPEFAAFAYLAVVGVSLALIDLAVQRLPDRLTLPAYPAVVLLLALAAVAGDEWGNLARALAAGLALTACYLVLGLLSSGQMGGGDIKLAGLIGLALGWLGWPYLVAGACLGFVLAALAGLLMLARRRVSRGSLMSFGPYMLSGAMLVVLASKP